MASGQKPSACTSVRGTFFLLGPGQSWTPGSLSPQQQQPPGALIPGWVRGRVELPPRAEGPLSWRWREASDLVLPINQAVGRGETEAWAPVAMSS